jgi:hypothetical protein
MSLANIHKNVRNKPSKRGWLTLAVRETVLQQISCPSCWCIKGAEATYAWCTSSHGIHALRKVFQLLQEAEVEKSVDSRGYAQEFYPALIAWIADLGEQWDILGLAKNSCPKCLSGSKDLDSYPCPHRCHTSDSIIDTLRSIRVEYPYLTDTWDFVQVAKTYGLELKSSVGKVFPVIFAE